MLHACETLVTIPTWERGRKISVYPSIYPYIFYHLSIKYLWYLSSVCPSLLSIIYESIIYQSSIYLSIYNLVSSINYLWSFNYLSSIIYQVSIISIIYLSTNYLSSIIYQLCVNYLWSIYLWSVYLSVNYFSSIYLSSIYVSMHLCSIYVSMHLSYISITPLQGSVSDYGRNSEHDGQITCHRSCNSSLTGHFVGGNNILGQLFLY